MITSCTKRHTLTLQALIAVILRHDNVTLQRMRQYVESLHEKNWSIRCADQASRQEPATQGDTQPEKRRMTQHRGLRSPGDLDGQVTPPGQWEHKPPTSIRFGSDYRSSSGITQKPFYKHCALAEALAPDTHQGCTYVSATCKSYCDFRTEDATQ